MATVLATIFWFSVVLLFYTYAGYPLMVWLLAALRPKAVARAADYPSVSIIIAVRNGDSWIAQKLTSCLCQDYPADLLEIVLVSDGCTDRTVEIAREIESPRIRIVELPEAQGKPAAINEAVRQASGDILIFTDMRQRLERDAVRQLVENFSDPSVGAASGELMLDAANGDGFGEGVDLYWRYEKWLRINEARYGSSVGVTGALYALRRDCFDAIPRDTLLDDVLIPMNVVEKGSRVIFDSRAIAHDMPSSSKIRERQRKIRTIAGNYQLLRLKPSLLNPRRNPIWWQYVSHKILRLAVPVLLFLALVTNIALLNEGWIYGLTLAGQILLYALAFAGIGLPRIQSNRLVRIPATFVMLNWFAVLGFVHFARHWNRGLRW